MARLAYDEGLLLDVASGGELHVALAAGVPASACTLHGNNKSVSELRMAIEAGVRHIVVDSFDELERLDALAAGRVGPAPKILLRVTPGVHAHTHEFIATGQDDSKFGFNLGNGDALRAVDRARRSASVELVGVHCHIGSNVFEASSFAKAAEVMADFAVPLDLPELVLGGGLGVAYVESEEAPTITQWGNVLLDACAALGVRSNVSVEPGRAIVAAAAMTVYTVGTIKEIPGVRTYVAVDGGMSDNPRPVLYGSGYESFLPRDGRRRAVADGRGSSASTASRATCCRSRPACPPTSRSATCWPCRSPARTATRWGRTTTRSPGLPSCSSPTAGRASSCAARRSTTSSPPTSADQPAARPGRVEMAQHGNAAGRQLVAGAVADRQTHRLQLADVVLERRGLAADRRGEIGGAHVRTLGDEPEGGAGPRAVRAACIEAVEARGDRVEILGRQPVVVAQRDTRVDPAGADADHVVGARGLGVEHRHDVVDRREAGTPGVVDG